MVIANRNWKYVYELIEEKKYNSFENNKGMTLLEVTIAGALMAVPRLSLNEACSKQCKNSKENEF